MPEASRDRSSGTLAVKTHSRLQLWNSHFTRHTLTVPMRLIGRFNRFCLILFLMMVEIPTLIADRRMC